MKIAIVAPCYNENHVVLDFLSELEKTLSGLNHEFFIVVVDDASTDNTLEILQTYQSENRRIRFKLITLKYNVGHQSAIYQGLLYADRFNADKYIVMDSDGEDDPSAIEQLVQINDADVVFVTRGKRKENIFFKISYRFYKLIFRIITNSSINFGNYSMISPKVLEIVKDRSFIHYSSFLSKLKIKKTEIKFDRRKRLDGKSKMNYQGLIMHGFKSYLEYAEELLIFFLKLFSVIIAFLVILIGHVLYKKLFTTQAILGWASTLTSNLVNAALICFGFFVIGILLLNIYNRNQFKQEKIYTEMK